MHDAVETVVGRAATVVLVAVLSGEVVGVGVELLPWNARVRLDH